MRPPPPFSIIGTGTVGDVGDAPCGLVVLICYHIRGYHEKCNRCRRARSSIRRIATPPLGFPPVPDRAAVLTLRAPAAGLSARPWRRPRFGYGVSRRPAIRRGRGAAAVFASFALALRQRRRHLPRPPTQSLCLGALFDFAYFNARSLLPLIYFQLIICRWRRCFWSKTVSAVSR